jgi:hypothetical protein
MTLLIIWCSVFALFVAAAYCKCGGGGIKIERNPKYRERPMWFRVHNKPLPKQVRL